LRCGVNVNLKVSIKLFFPSTIEFRTIVDGNALT
jgi:hypothetical protein